MNDLFPTRPSACEWLYCSPSDACEWFYRSLSDGFRALPAAAGVTSRLWYPYHGVTCALASIRHYPERWGKKIMNRL